MEFKIKTKTDLFRKPNELYKDIYNNKLDKLKLYKYLDLKFSDEYIIYVISDIHADFKRFLDFLELNQFIICDKNQKDIDCVWNPEKKKVILVICGDFIDGFRGRDNLHLGEHNELSLLQLIYNLRLDAINYNSFIFCTLGNHDYFSIHPMLDSNGSHTYAYLDYIDTNSYNFYLGNSPFKDLKINEFDLVFMTRAFYLSRFYSVGYPFFLKINDTIFAHAGFHKNREIFDKFTANSKSNFNLSPMLFHRKILEKLSNIDTYNDFLKQNSSIDLTYKNLYNSIVNLIIKKYEIDNVFNTRNMAIEINTLKNSSNNSILDNFFLTREIRNDCDRLEDILKLYNCNLLVVGHCPTCVCDFNEDEVKGITSCNDARIVFSCNKKLATVDIAFSSAFSPKKKFLESLCIYTNDSKKHTHIQRLSLNKSNQSKNNKIYNRITYDSNTNTWN